jgi:hypothetical protein
VVTVQPQDLVMLDAPEVAFVEDSAEFKKQMMREGTTCPLSFPFLFPSLASACSTHDSRFIVLQVGSGQTQRSAAGTSARGSWSPGWRPRRPAVWAGLKKMQGTTPFTFLLQGVDMAMASGNA